MIVAWWVRALSYQLKGGMGKPTTILQQVFNPNLVHLFKSRCIIIQEVASTAHSTTDT